MKNWITEKGTGFIVLILYLTIFISSVHHYETPPDPPQPGSETRGLNLTQALKDLQFITTRPHPYNSRANDAVRSYILSRLEGIENGTQSLILDNDMFSNVTWYRSGSVMYFEGNNILVKIEGQRPELKAVLFSAHYDSVPTGRGATDNSMGVATLLQLISYFSNHKPSRSVIFNINNGEEDGLHGSQAFLNHPWSNQTGFFLNLEGAGAGGMPIVFRTSSYQVSQALKTASHPHGSVLCGDAFALGLIRSSTDYSVYTAAGMSGLDFAFYQRRSHYHTMRDTISNLNGPGSLWALMETSLSIGIALTQFEPLASENSPLSVYFDIYANFLVLFTLKHFYVANIILLGIGVVICILFDYCLSRPSIPRLFVKEAIYFPIVCAFSIIMLAVLCLTYLLVNPYIVYSSKYLVASSALILAFASLHLPLSYLSERAPDLHETILYEMNLFWWLILLLNTVFLIRQGIGGLYFVTFFYGTSLLTLILSSLELSTSRENGASPNDNTEADPDDQGETTPLLSRERAQPSKMTYHSYLLWSLKFILCVPLPVVLVTQVGVILLNALSQTLSDGSSASFVYSMVALVSFLLVLPLVPFMPKIHRSMSFVLLWLFLLIFGFNLLSRPFLGESPLKVFFSQAVNLTEQTNMIHLAGIEGYVQKVIGHIPSAAGQPVSCERAETKRSGGLTTCKWSGITTLTEDMISVTTQLIQPGKGVLKVRGEDTRFCMIRFDNPISTFYIHGTTGEIQAGYPLPSNGVKELRLWSRKRSKEFIVDVSWPENETLHGRVSCGWSDSEDWESRNPAFREVLDFLPSWSVVNDFEEELVEASLEFLI